MLASVTELPGCDAFRVILPRDGAHAPSLRGHVESGVRRVADRQTRRVTTYEVSPQRAAALQLLVWAERTRAQIDPAVRRRLEAIAGQPAQRFRGM